MRLTVIVSDSNPHASVFRLRPLQRRHRSQMQPRGLRGNWQDSCHLAVAASPSFNLSYMHVCIQAAAAAKAAKKEPAAAKWGNWVAADAAADGAGDEEDEEMADVNEADDEDAADAGPSEQPVTRERNIGRGERVCKAEVPRDEN